MDNQNERRSVRQMIEEIKKEIGKSGIMQSGVNTTGEDDPEELCLELKPCHRYHDEEELER